SSSSSSSSGHSGGSLEFAIVFNVIFMVIAIFYIKGTFSVIFGIIKDMLHIDKLKEFKPTKEKRQPKLLGQLPTTAVNDHIWSPDYIMSSVQRIFRDYQRDWGDLNTESIKDYMSDYYLGHATLMMEALRDIHRRNVTTIIGEIIDVTINTAIDDPGNTNDRFIAQIRAYVRDSLIDAQTKKELYSSVYELNEAWEFVRVNNEWKLNGINPATASANTRVMKLVQFAAANNAYYSLDWGWLLLPQRGQLFRGRRFGISDINNHVIGRFSNSGRAIADDTIYQIYTYSRRPLYDGAKEYLVGQITLPKHYDNIIVRRRRLGSFKLGYRKVKLEWTEFNNRFDVFVAKSDRIASLELLNPQMMERLMQLDHEINMEVVDNVIYFYAPFNRIRGGKTADNYSKMLDTLQLAYRELKL
ncbi:MAG: DUF3137 domain-containing protein, partial [Candidatus Saccharibacteria bacterium]|nr:DUF3137 domain-containing protein [Candidatus Saccharibacteria bacterium]